MGKTKKNYLKKAFSLVEISIALLIIATISGGMISMSLVQNDKANREQTINKLKLIEDSLLTFISVNKRLPCPANPMLPADHPNFGVERCGCNEFAGNFDNDSIPINYNCPNSNRFIGGDVPFKSLDLPKQFAFDGWGNKIFYNVTEAFTGSNDNACRSGTPEISFNFNDCNMGLLKIHSNGLQFKNENVVYALLSFGDNGLGGYSASPKNRIMPQRQSPEFENAELNSGIFREKIYEKSDDVKIYYDDILHFKTKKQLMTDLNIVISNGSCDIAEEILSANDLLCGTNPGNANCPAYMSNLANQIKNLCL